MNKKKFFVLTITDEADGNLFTGIFNQFDNAVKFAKEDLRDHSHIGENDDYGMSEDEFAELAKEMADNLETQGIWWDVDRTEYCITESEVLD